MAIVITPESEYGKELARWQRKPNYNPDAPENQFPRMMYMANRRPDGVISVNETTDAPFANLMDAHQNFNRRCQRIVKSEAEMIVALEQGWRKSQKEALERFESKESLKADAAAHRAYEDRSMGDKAKAEAARAEAETSEHVAEVAEAPKQKRKYTRRSTAAA